jgi:heat shock protein HslJ
VLDGGKVAGFGGCNQLAGQYMLQSELTPAQGALTFSVLTATHVACQTGMDTETAFLAALARVRRFSVSGIHLDLFDDARGRLLRFEVRVLY